MILELVVVLLLMFVFMLPQMMDNWRRNEMRVECREWWTTNATTKLPFHPCHCGYSFTRGECPPIKPITTKSMASVHPVI